MREWSLSSRIRRSRSTAQAVYLTERSISRYAESKADWLNMFEPVRVDAAREKLNRKSLLKIAASRYFKPLRLVFSF
jgi:hypothetical protein